MLKTKVTFDFCVCFESHKTIKYMKLSLMKAVQDLIKIALYFKRFIRLVIISKLMSLYLRCAHYK